MNDKLKHFLVSGVGVILIAFILNLMQLHYSTEIAAGMMLLVGLGKEFIYDLAMKRGNFEWLDLLADVGGIIVGYLIIKF